LATDRTDRDINAAFELGTPIEDALNEAGREAVRQHKTIDDDLYAIAKTFSG